MMKGLLTSKGIVVAENRLGKSLKRVDPSNHIRRATLTYFRTNPSGKLVASVMMPIKNCITIYERVYL